MGVPSQNFGFSDFRTWGYPQSSILDWDFPLIIHDGESPMYGNPHITKPLREVKNVVFIIVYNFWGHSFWSTDVNDAEMMEDGVHKIMPRWGLGWFKTMKNTTKRVVNTIQPPCRQEMGFTVNIV